LHRFGEKPGVGLAIGKGFGVARDAVARWLIALGCTPNRVTAAGLIATCGAGLCLVLGAGHRLPWGASPADVPASWWPLGAAAMLFLAGAFDMLDGAIARLGKMRSAFGAVLDSTLDRFSDMAVYTGCAVHFALHGNLTYTVLAIAAMTNAYMISYVKARAENLLEDCSVGYWLRGERCGAMLIAAFCGHIPAALWQQATLPFLTVLRRIRYAAQALHAREDGRPAPRRGPLDGPGRFIALWRFPRGSLPYDLVTGFNILFLVAAPWVQPFFYGRGDPLGVWLAGLFSPVA